jgi:lipopolysaccharide transport system ATP-binding protein
MLKESSASTIVVENVSKKYVLTQKGAAERANEFWALKNISFTLNEGDKLGIIGANGSGKTTLLKLLSQATKPTAGRILLKGKTVSILDIGSGFHPDLSGRANVKLYGKMMLGMSDAEIEKSLPDIIEFSELNQFIDEPIKNYSNGMYLRLALSIALFCRLDILLLDEVFSVGDNAFMVKSYDKMNQIIKQAATIVLASHNMDDILRVCNKCLWLEKGEIKQFGYTEEVFAAYSQANQVLLEAYATPNHTLFSSHKKWEPENAPQNEDIKITAISIRNNNIQTEIFDYNDPIIIAIDYTTTNPLQQIGFSIDITDYLGNPLLTSGSNLDEKFRHAPNGQIGEFTCQCHLPAKFFNQGIYKINISALANSLNSVLKIKDVLSFKVVIQQDFQSELLNSTPIRLAPTFPWSTTAATSQRK